MFTKNHVILSVVCSFCSVSAAQTTSAPNIINQESAKLKTVEAVLPELSSSELNAGSSVAYLLTGTDKKVAFFRFGDVFEGVGTRRWQVSLEVPYDEGKGTSTLGDFDGFVDTANAAFTYTKMRIHDRKTPPAYVDAREVLCVKYLENQDYEGEGCVGSDFAKEYVIRADGSGPCKDIVEPLECAELGEQRKTSFNQAVEDLVHSLPPGGFPEPIRADLWSIEAKVGPENYSYRDPITLEKESQRETPWSLAASFNYLKGFTTYGLEFAVQEGFKQKGEKELCEPFEGFTAVFSCSKARIGAPSKQRRKLLSLKISHFSKAHSFAVQPKLTYDFEEDEFAIELPVFLLRNADKQLTGGITLGWDSEDEDVTGGVFIGKAFELF